MDYNSLNSNYDALKNEAFSGRYLEVEEIHTSLLNLPKEFSIRQIGESVNKIPIYAAFWGNGKKKVLAWSQMHGNETTTTKALFDFVNYLILEKNSDFIKHLFNSCEMALVFVLNPDGAKAYTRVNANEIDLNRDALEATQPEMKALHELYSSFKPNLCLNLHGQRSIFSAGTNNHSAVVSFLSPSVNETRSLTSTRIVSMRLIAEMNAMLQDFIPNQVGRYDDAYNPNCTGDYFQNLETPTILFEAGHINTDYEREETRKLMFLTYVKVFESFIEENYSTTDHKLYFEIPNNQKLFFDCILRNVQIGKAEFDFAIQYEEVLKDNTIEFIPKLVQIDNLEQVYAHREEILNEELVSLNGKMTQKCPKINSVIEEIRTKNRVFSLKILKK